MEQLYFTCKLCICFLFIFSRVTTAVNDLTNSLCNTCTPICSSPPSSTINPPLLPPPSPPAVIASKPPPSTPVHHAPPPPRFYYFDSPVGDISPPLIGKSNPPPAYITLGGNKGAPPPPRIVYFPSTEVPLLPAAAGGGGSGQTMYPYPYYGYDSKAGKFSVGFLWLLVSFHLTFLVLV